MHPAAFKPAQANRSATRTALIRYFIALAILAVITGASFVLVRSLIGDMKNTEVVVSDAADLRSSIHKTMLALDAVAADASEQNLLSAKAEAEMLRSSTDRLLLLLARADVGENIWSIIRTPADGLEPSIRMLIERAAAAHPMSGHDMAPAPAGSGHPSDHSSTQMAHAMGATEATSSSTTHAHNTAAMTAVDELIKRLRADARQAQDRAAFTHDALGYGTLLILLIEGLIVFRPLLRTARAETKRANQATHELEFLASHDALTGLLNRGQIDRVLQVAVSEAASVKQQLGLILLDLDEFKPINDTLGHAAGDAVLIGVAKRLRAALRPGDICGRLGGDEFIIVLPNIEQEPDIQAVANDILNSLAEPIAFEGQEILAKASIGYAMFPIAGGDVGALMSAADLAMYDAKRKGRGRVSEFSQQMRAEAERSRNTEAALRDAFANREFEVHFQTIHAAQTGEAIAVEALVRWRHPQRGLVSPMDFLSDVRRTGRMGSLTAFVLSEALAQFAVWRAAGYTVRGVHVNIGDEFLRDRDAQQSLIRMLATHGIAPRELVLEITEDVRIEDKAVKNALTFLSEAGITIAVDDFGVGSVSVADLDHPAIKLVKLDKAIVQAAVSDPKGAAVLASLRELFRAMDKTLVAEGVETAQIRDITKAAGIELLQGYHFGRPGSAVAITGLLAACDTPRQPQGHVAA